MLLVSMNHHALNYQRKKIAHVPEYVTKTVMNVSWKTIKNFVCYYDIKKWTSRLASFALIDSCNQRVCIMKGPLWKCLFLKQIDNCSENNFCHWIEIPPPRLLQWFFWLIVWFLTHSYCSPCFSLFCREFRNRRNPKATKETGDGTKMTRIE